MIDTGSELIRLFSSIILASSATLIGDFLSSPYSSASSFISFLIYVFKRCLDPNNTSISFFSVFNSFNSDLIFNSSSLASFLNHKSNIEFACISLSLKFLISLVLLNNLILFR